VRKWKFNHKPKAQNLTRKKPVKILQVNTGNKNRKLRTGAIFLRSIIMGQHLSQAFFWVKIAMLCMLGMVVSVNFFYQFFRDRKVNGQFILDPDYLMIIVITAICAVMGYFVVIF
jgi:hypothetical protein